jgi:uncharacterized protein
MNVDNMNEDKMNEDKMNEDNMNLDNMNEDNMNLDKINVDITGKKCDALIELSLEDKDQLLSYINLRPIYSCEYGLTTLFMWQNMYSPHVYFDANYLIIFEHYENECYALMPLCKEAYFEESFNKAIQLFEDINETFEMYCVDDLYANFVKEHYRGMFHVDAPRELTDYIYEAEKLRVLSGDKLRKKRNHINAFLRDYEGRYEHRLLTIEDRQCVHEFLEAWCEAHGDENSHLQEEMIGIDAILQNIELLGAKVLGVFVDQRLEAFSIASCINNNTEAIIHVEKANYDMRGLYPFINQLFLVDYLPDVTIVNREDDLGIEGLRKSKMSYEPLRLENKYTITKIADA